MSVHLPSRLLTWRATVQPLIASHFLPLSYISQPQSRSVSWGSLFGSRNSKSNGSNLDDLSKNPELRRQLTESYQPHVQSSIYDDHTDTPADQPTQAGRPKRKRLLDGRRPAIQSKAFDAMPGVPSVLPEHREFGIDPDPRARIRRERKWVIQMVRRDGHTTKKERILATERVTTLKSQWYRTSTKKLGNLARQIAGKTLDDAMVQMQFSKKKWAAKIHDHLDYARDRAIAIHGMGLGEANGEAPLRTPIKIQTKDGKKLAIHDPTRLYIDEAWVNRGPKELTRMIRHGRGRKSPAYKPRSSITVRLKEEKTRIRQHGDRELKELRAKPWVHHPDKPLYGQRQHYTW